MTIASHSDVEAKSGTSRTYLDTQESEQWGQPPVVMWVLKVNQGQFVGEEVGGPYLHSSSPSAVEEESHPGEEQSALSAELAGWDMLSDEALLAFEDSLE